MIKLFSKFLRFKKKWDFNGGIYPPAMKNQSNTTPIRKIPLAKNFIIPLKQHIGQEGELCVRPGDYVFRGQQLTFGNDLKLPVHAPTSGRVIAIEPRIIACSSILTALSIIIKPDGKDHWIDRNGWNNYREHDRKKLIDRIHQFGIAGLGGAGFPTAAKLRRSNNKIETLIINATECEPYITADDRLIQECAAQIIEGIRILAYILQPNNVLIGIENNKIHAISVLRTLLADSNDITINLCIIPTKYPSGSSRQLTQILTGKQIPHGGYSSDIGVLIQNISTVFAVKRAIINGEPLTERVITLTGKSILHPGNVWGRLGTPISHLLKHSGFYPNDDNQRVIMGGPFMGVTLSRFDIPVIKITNCLLVPSVKEMKSSQNENACIRCDACTTICPMNLLPQQLYWYSKSQQYVKVKEYNLTDCIECGACSWVCPSNIPLVQYFRKAKAEICVVTMEQKRSDAAKARFNARQKRLKYHNQLITKCCNKPQNTMVNVNRQIQKHEDTNSEEIKEENKKQSIIIGFNMQKLEVKAAIIRAKEHRKERRKKLDPFSA